MTKMADDAARLIVAVCWPEGFEIDAETQQAIAGVIDMACAAAVSAVDRPEVAASASQGEGELPTSVEWNLALAGDGMKRGYVPLPGSAAIADDRNELSQSLIDLSHGHDPYWADVLMRAAMLIAATPALSGDGALRRALEQIKAEEGRVCAHYDTCTHEACASSHRAWEIADAALSAPAAVTPAPTTREFHIAFNAAIRRVTNLFVPACVGPDCAICAMAASWLHKKPAKSLREDTSLPAQGQATAPPQPPNDDHGSV
jgi:hypothetical protein